MLKNITLSAEEGLIKKARTKARKDRTTLNSSFRQWLRQYANVSLKNDDYDWLMDSLKYVKTGGKFSREEMNDR